MKTPVHVAIILDGNGRWAKSKGLPRNAGHIQGAKNVEVICEAAHNLGIKYLTLYAFSTENWNRPRSEVDALMKLLRNYLKTCLKTAKKNNMRVRVIGDKTGLDEDIQLKIKELEKASSVYDGLNLQIAINYGSRDEMLRSIKKLASDIKAEKLQIEDLTEEVIGDYLDTKDLPDPDLLIRTSGEQRISNYLLWQIAYTELYFTNVPWPDFNEEELKKALLDYQGRDRRFGKIKEEKHV